MMKSKKGFTLVELAIVIVVIGILAAIAIPRFLTMQEAAGKAALDANFDALRTAIVAIKARTGVTPTVNDLRNGYVKDPVSGKKFPFFSSPTSQYDDVPYSKYLLSTPDTSVSTRVGNPRCPRGFSGLWLNNTVKKVKRGKVLSDVYGLICYRQQDGALRKTW